MRCKICYDYDYYRFRTYVKNTRLILAEMSSKPIFKCLTKTEMNRYDTVLLHRTRDIRKYETYTSIKLRIMENTMQEKIRIIHQITKVMFKVYELWINPHIQNSMGITETGRETSLLLQVV